VATDAEWASAFAAQALSDLHALEILSVGGADKCHRLHFLQMSAEKVCKAYLMTQNGYDAVRKVHSYVESVLPVIARQFASLAQGSDYQTWQLGAIKSFAKNIELLAPSCDEGETRPDNSEYPWADAAGRVYTPCRYKFSHIDDGDRIVVTIVQLLRVAAAEYLRS
jgi:hypothetical protein